jgi:adenine-specific DNA-methyltransferase
MPVMILIRHGDATGAPVLSIAVINRRRNKVYAEKDVLEKVTLIRDISLTDPHRGHLDILASFAVENLVHPKKLPITDFDSLHAAWEQIFNIELLNARFYRELSNWYFWALPQVEFPADLEPDDEKRRATGLIRLLTRLIFCWFLKEKNLIPEKLFHPADLGKILKGFDPESETSSTYYQAILQNLFFATLNQRMGKDGHGKPYRLFATDEGFQKNRTTYDVNNLYRYEKLFAGSHDEALTHFADIPFLNGGLFECLDRTEDGTDKKRYLDGFSRNDKKRPHIPDRLFFDSGETADLSGAYGDKKRKKEQVTGLITILNRYKFTIVENTPIDQEIALDPELLGKVFENLLASYNEETKTTARKQTGSFYTPRPIVDYMVDESLKAHLTRKLEEAHTKARSHEEEKDLEKGSASDPLRASASPRETPSSETLRAFVSSCETRLSQLFSYTEQPHQFPAPEVATLIAAIDALKILDPACGSGAFPMGVLHKLVYILGKLDPDNDRWRQTQLAKLDSAPMREELERAFADNNDDYGRKLYLIENCLYGVDIQPIAIQITKLRFFISLVCDQKTNRNKKDNHGIRPLPNLETKFVAANTLIGLPIPEPDLFIRNLIEPIEKEIEQGYHSHFSIQRRDQKIALQKRIKTLRQKLSDTLIDGLGANKNSDIAKKAQLLADWDPFDPQSSADFFDPHWMYGKSLADGFDIVVGNPPYVLLQAANRDDALTKYFRQNYKVASYKIDLYHLFIEQGVNLLKPSGTISLITPTNFASNNFTVLLRRFLLTETHLEKLVFFDEGVFDASVHNVVFVAHSNRQEAITTSFYKATMADAQLDLQIKSEVKQSELIDDMCLLMVRTGNTAEGIIQKMNLARETIGSAATVNFGMQLRDRSVFCDDVVETPISKSSLTKFHRECYAGKDVRRFYVSFTDRYCYFNREAKRGGCWDEDIHFAKGKILVRQIGRYPEGGIDMRGYAVLNASFMILPRTEAFDSKFLLGVLNSSSVRFYWLNKFKDDRKTFPKIKGEYLKLLPLPKTEPEKQTPIIQSVSRIIDLKEKDSAADTSALEREIDQQVYALYGLTPEEIAIVEGTAQ